MEFFKIDFDDGSFEHSNIPIECFECYKSCPLGITILEKGCNNKRRKRFYEKTEKGVFYFCSDEDECLGSNKVFKSKISVVKEIVPLFNDYKAKVLQEQNIQNKRIFHNVVSLNGHNIQELYALVSDKVLAHKVDQQRSIVKDAIEKRSDEAASMFLRIAKNNLAIQTNFNVFNKLSQPNPVMNYRKQKVRRVLLTVYHVFFQDFFEKNIRVVIDDFDLEFFLDYESISVAFYHLLDNATKYAMPNSIINIKFFDDREYCKISFEMDSIEIKEDEKTRLIEEGFKGETAKEMESKGDGIGMFIISQLLKLNKGTFGISTSSEKPKRYYMSIPYRRNQFFISIPKYAFKPR